MHPWKVVSVLEEPQACDICKEEVFNYLRVESDEFIGVCCRACLEELYKIIERLYHDLEIAVVKT